MNVSDERSVIKHQCIWHSILFNRLLDKEYFVSNVEDMFLAF